MEDAVRIVGQSFVRAENADELVELVVVRFDVVVRDRPVIAQAVQALAPEIVGAEAQRDASPVVGPAADHAGAPPVEAIVLGARVRLALDLPTADARIEFAERSFARGAAASGRVVKRREHAGVARIVPRAARFQHDDVRAGLREHVRGRTAARARADDHYIVFRALLHNLRRPEGKNAAPSRRRSQRCKDFRCAKLARIDAIASVGRSCSTK